MKKKTFNLISGIVGGVEAVAVALVTFFNPNYAAAINASIVIAGTAVTEICALFVKEENA